MIPFIENLYIKFKTSYKYFQGGGRLVKSISFVYLVANKEGGI